MRATTHTKVFVGLAICLCLIAGELGATTYTSTSDGAYDNNGTWDISAPGNTLDAGDSVIINHDVTFDAKLTIRGVLIVNADASLVEDGSQNIDVGKGTTNSGVIYNYGYIQAKDLKVEPDNGASTSDPYPVMHNFDTVVAEKLNIGNGEGVGTYYNEIGSVTTTTAELHIDGVLFNFDTMYAEVKFKVHGGFINECGYIETPLLDIDENQGRPGEFNCIRMCQNNGFDPVFDVDGTTYADKQDAYILADTAEMKVDIDSTVICGFSVEGNALSLPIELLSFDCEAVNNAVTISWVTELEINNYLFEIERSIDGENWERVAEEFGAGNSTEDKYYSIIDEDPIFGVSYYRLKQIDYDGRFEYFPAKSVTVESTAVGIYPNPTFGQVYLRSVPSNTIVKVANMMGEVLMTSSSTDQNIEIDMGSLPMGMYIISVGNDSHLIQKY